MSVLVVLPSYNESLNIVELIDRILALDSTFDVVVVDDNSPDGTGELLEKHLIADQLWQRRVTVLHRGEKAGRGSAVRTGLAHGMAHDGTYEVFVEMDCDFSHDPSEIPIGLLLLKDGAYDAVIGSRYPDGAIIDWPLSRRVFSHLANRLARLLLRWSIHDYTNGFRIYTREAAEALVTSEARTTGFIYLSESLAILLQRGCRIGAFPTVFRNRVRGTSNTSLKEVWRAFKGLLWISWRYRVRLGGFPEPRSR